MAGRKGAEATVDFGLFVISEGMFRGLKFRVPVEEGALMGSESTSAATDFVAGVEASSHGNFVGSGTVDIRSTVNAIENGTLKPRNSYGYKNNELHPELLGKPPGYWQEYHLLNFGPKSPMRILRGGQGEYFFSPDHYRSVIPIRKN